MDLRWRSLPNSATNTVFATKQLVDYLVNTRVCIPMGLCRLQTLAPVNKIRRSYTYGFSVLFDLNVGDFCREFRQFFLSRCVGMSPRYVDAVESKESALGHLILV